MGRGSWRFFSSMKRGCAGQGVAVAVLLELGPELDEHGGADDDGADDDGVRDHGAVDHRHLGQEEPRLDELDDHGQVILRRREGANHTYARRRTPRAHPVPGRGQRVRGAAPGDVFTILRPF